MVSGGVVGVPGGEETEGGERPRKKVRIEGQVKWGIVSWFIVPDGNRATFELPGGDAWQAGGDRSASRGRSGRRLLGDRRGCKASASTWDPGRRGSQGDLWEKDLEQTFPTVARPTRANGILAASGIIKRGSDRSSNRRCSGHAGKREPDVQLSKSRRQGNAERRRGFARPCQQNRGWGHDAN